MPAAIITAVALSFPLASSAAAPPRSAGARVCAVPNILIAGGETQAARTRLVAILSRDPSAGCALKALKKLNTPQAPKSCAAADASFDAGHLASAASSYRKLGDLSCAVSGLASVRDVKRLCAQGDAERKLGNDSATRTAYEGALSKSPKAQCASDGLSAISGYSFADLMHDIAVWTPQILGAIGMILAVLLILLLFGYNRRVMRLLLRMPITRSILGPRLALGPLDDSCQDVKFGAAITARIKEHLQRYRDEALGADESDYDLDYGTGAEDFVDIVSGSAALQNALDSARDISDQTKAVAALFDLIYGALPIRKISVNGVLDPPDPHQACATFALQDGIRQAAAVTLSAPTADAPTSADYAKLAQPAAVWIQYGVTRLLKGDIRLPPEAPASYALLREGLNRQNEGDTAEAERAYEQAVALNSRNWAARVNLATLRARRQGDPGSAIATVSEALDDIRRDEHLP